MHLAAVKEAYQAVGTLGHPLVVGNHDDGGAFLLVEAEEDVHDFIAHHTIQVTGGLISENNLWSANDGPRDGYPLLLSARELARKVMHPVVETYLFQCFFCQATAFFTIHLAVKEGQFYVVQHRKVIDQVETLEDKAQVLVAKSSRSLAIVVGDRLIGNHNAALAGLVDKAHDVEQGTFSTARRPHDGQEFSFFNLQVDGVQRQRFDRISTVDFTDVFQVQHISEVFDFKGTVVCRDILGEWYLVYT